MISTSTAFNTKIKAGARRYTKMTFIFTDSTTRNITEDDIVGGSVVYTGGTSSSGKFDVGGCIIKSLKFALNNFDGRFDSLAWKGLKIQPYFGVETSTNTFEWVCPDTFYLVTHKTTGNIITCEAYDGMKLLDEGFITVTQNQTTLGAVTECLTAHGLTANTSTWYGYNIQLPASEQMTHRQCLAYIMQRTGNLAVMKQGVMYIMRYARTGSVTIISTYFDLTYQLQNLAFTGVRYTANDGTTYTRGTVTGSNAYVYEVKEGDNPFCPKSVGDSWCGYLWAFIQPALNSRPGNITALSDPRIEPGDRIRVYRRVDASTVDGSMYMLVTNFEYKPSLQMKISYDAEEPEQSDLRESVLRQSADTVLNHAVTQSKSYTDNKLTVFDAEYNRFKLLMAQSSGLFYSEEVQQDNSKIYYMHDKQDRLQSDLIWKLDNNGFTVSRDGGVNYTAGVASDGTIIAQKLIGKYIYGDIIQAGTISDHTGRNSWDLTNGILTLTNGTITDQTGNSSWNLQTGNLQIQGEFHTVNYNRTSGQWITIDNGDISGGRNVNDTVDIIPKTKITLAASVAGLNPNGSSFSEYGTIVRTNAWSFVGETNTIFNMIDSRNQYVLRIDGENKQIKIACEVDMGHRYIRNPNFLFGDFGEVNPTAVKTDTFDFISVKSLNPDGTVLTHQNGKLIFKNGLLISGSTM